MLLFSKSSFFSSSNACLKISFSFSCLSVLYLFKFLVISFASTILSVKNSFNASSWCPILPHAFILGATPKDIVLESILLYPKVFISSFSPMFLVISTSLKPSFAITLFSSTSGTMSDIVPIATISKYFKYSLSSKPNSLEIACISLNTTPTPASSLNGYWLSFLFASTTAYAFGIFSACSWWSVIIV